MEEAFVQRWIANIEASTNGSLLLYYAWRSFMSSRTLILGNVFLKLEPETPSLMN